MSSTYSGLNSYHPSIVIPSDGDPAVAESVNVALRALCDDAVYAATQLTHQAADDRGKTSTITGAIIWNDGGGSLTVQIDTSFHNLDVIGDFHVHDEGEFQVFSQATFMSHANFADVVEMASTLTVRGAAEFRDDVLLGFNDDDEIEVRGALVVNNQSEFHDSVQLGFDSGDEITVGGVLVANESVTIHGTLTSTGSSDFGNTTSDDHEFTGDVTLHNDLTVGQDTDLEGDVQVEGDLDVTGTTTLHGEIELLDDVTLGGASSDEITVNGKIVTPVGFADAGRILTTSGNVSAIGTQTLTTSSSRVIYCATNGSAGTVLFNIDDSGMSNGDAFTFFLFNTSPSVIQISDSNSGGTLTLSANFIYAVVVAKRIEGVWRKMGWRVTGVGPGGSQAL